MRQLPIAVPRDSAGRSARGTEYAGSWPRNFLRAYEEGLLDYYLVTAALPVALAS